MTIETSRDRDRGRGGGKGPGRALYLLALLPPICGFATLIIILVTRLPTLDDGLQQIVVPGSRDLALQPGVHTVFLERHSVVDGRVYAVDELSGLQVRVQAADGTPVEVTTPVGSASYSLGARQGDAINVFRVETAGTYRVSASYEGQAGPQTVIAVGLGFMTSIFATVLSALGAVFLGIILGVAVLAAVYFSRRRTRRGG